MSHRKFSVAEKINIAAHVVIMGLLLVCIAWCVWLLATGRTV